MISRYISIRISSSVEEISISWGPISQGFFWFFLSFTFACS